MSFLDSPLETHENLDSQQWFRIVVKPNKFTGERLNIGIAVKNNQHFITKVIGHTDRLHCLYGESGADNIVFAAEQAKSLLESGKSLNTVFENSVFLDGPFEYYNLEAEEALLAFFNEQVPLGIENAKKEKKERLEQDKFRAKVYQLMKNKAPDIADYIIPQSQSSVIEHNQKKKSVTVPLQSHDAFGALENAGYKTAQTIRVHLMDAWMDLEAASEARQIKRMGFFIARPKTDNEAWQLLMDNAIDDVIWRMPNSCHVEVNDNLDHLADEILDWMPVKTGT